MDRIIEKKRGLKKRHLPYIALGLFLLFALGWMIFGNHASKMNVDKERLNIQTVTFGQFNDYVRISGQVQPINIVQLSAIEGGMVAEKLVEEGTMVREGQIIVRLTNPNLSLSILDSEAQLAEKQNFLRNTQVTMEQERLTLRSRRLELDMDIERKRRRHDQFQKLYNEGLCSKEEFLIAKEDYEFAQNSRALVLERQKQDSIFRTIQVSQMEESLYNMRRNLILVRQRIDNLDIKAPVSGQLGLLDVEIGQSVGTGSRIGQISVLSDYKVEASIDEHYIDRVKPDLSATFERQESTFALRVRRVYPEVRGGQFKTEFLFEGDRPDNIRTGQTYFINLQLGQPAQAVMIPRGAFYQTTGGQWIFVLSADGSKAVRRRITIGRQNPNFYEVTNGLEADERVIVSSYDNFGDSQELILK